MTDTELKREFNRLVKKCEGIMKECGFHLPKSIKYELNGRMTRALGKCSRDRYFNYTIKVAKKTFAEYITRGNFHHVEDTILHEMCHAMPDGMNHGAGWMQYTRVVNRKFGYDIKRFCQRDEVIEKVAYEANPIVQICCPECGKTYNVRQKSKYNKLPQVYKCGVCNHFGLVKK